MGDHDNPSVQLTADSGDDITGLSMNNKLFVCNH